MRRQIRHSLPKRPRENQILRSAPTASLSQGLYQTQAELHKGSQSQMGG